MPRKHKTKKRSKKSYYKKTNYTKKKTNKRSKKSYYKKTNYTKKKNINRVKNTKKRKRNKQDGGITMGEFLIPIIIEYLGNFLETECGKWAKRNKLKNAKGEPIEKCGLNELKNTKQVGSFAVEQLVSYFKTKINRNGKLIPKVFKEKLGEVGLSLNPIQLRKKENITKLLEAIRLTFYDERIKGKDEDIGVYFANIASQNGSNLKEDRYKKFVESAKKQLKKFNPNSQGLKNQTVSEAHEVLLKKLNA
jgi:hypothetical protein